MPYLAQTDEDELNLNTVNPDGVGYAHGASPRSEPAAYSSPTPGATPTNFVNFDRIFNANADAAKAGANELAGRVGKAAQGAQDAAGSADDQYRIALANGALPQAPDAGQLYGSTPGVKRQEMQGDGPQIGAPPTGPQPTSIDAARGYAESEFAAPRSLLDTQYGADAATQVRRAQSQVNALSDDKIAGLVGGNSMDAALIGSAGRSSFDALQKKYGRLAQAFGEQLKTEGGLYDDAKNGFEAARGSWRDAVGGYDADRTAAAEAPSKQPDDDTLKKKYQAWASQNPGAVVNFDEWKAQGYPGWENL